MGFWSDSYCHHDREDAYGNPGEHEESGMGLVTEDLTSLLTFPEDEPQENPFGASAASPARATDHSGWHHAVYRLRKWLRTTLTHHGEHGDGLTR